MPESTEDRRARRKREAVRGVLGFALLQIVCGASFLALCLIPGLPGWLFVPFAALAVGCLLLILPAVRALKARFKEIEGGELDAAAQY